MRPRTQLSIALALSVFATACGGDITSSLLSPTHASLAKAQGSQSIPFRGTIETADHAVLAPPNLLVTGSGEGNATHLGRYTATYDAVASLVTSTATGTYRLTAANGDQLVATFVGSAVNVAPALDRFTEILTVVSGTGRFANATGSITITRLVAIDFPTQTSTSTGSMEGEIRLR